MLNEIKEKLKGLNPNVFYGLAKVDVEEWNYIVFGRKSHNVSEKNNRDAVEYYFVAIVNEEYIPEETAASVIETMTSIPGMRVTPGTHDYNYAKKGGTDMTVEVLELEFYRAKRGR